MEKNTKYKFYYLQEFEPLTGIAAVPVEKSMELSQSNIGEVCDDNTEIIKETKESLTLLSVEIEPEKSE